MIAATIANLRRRFYAWIGYRDKLMTHDELLARIAADVTDLGVDRLLPPSLRKYPPADPKTPLSGGT